MTKLAHSALTMALAFATFLAGCSGRSSEPAAAGPSKPFVGQVDVGDHSLFMQCRGSGSPTVVLESGIPGDHRTWGAVAPQVSKETRVCSYDRANTGRSDPASSPRTARDIVRDLHVGLRAEGEQPPYVLVGFSFGGLTTQLYAANHPNEVAGVVLVESNHPDEQKQFAAHLTRAQIARDRAFVKDNPEGVDVFKSFHQVQAAGDLPDVPLVVVTAGISEGWPPGWDPIVFDRLRAAEQEDLANLTPQGTQIVAKNSAHDVPNQQPQAVINAIHAVLEEADEG